MNKSKLYHCGVDELWKRQTGQTFPRAFAHRMGGCEDLIQRLELSGKLRKHRGCVNTVHFNPSGDILVSGSDDREIILWDWAAKVPKLSFHSGHTDNVFQAKVMPYTDDKKIVSCAADGQVRLCQIQDDGRVDTKKIGKHRGRAHKLAIEPGSSHVFFSCGEDGVVQRFDLRTEAPAKLFTCHAFETDKAKRPSLVRLNAIVTDERNPCCFALGGSDEYARVYDIRKCQFESSKKVTQPVNCFSPHHLIGNNSVHITGLAYSNQSELLVSYNDELIYLFQKDMDLGPSPNTPSSQISEEAEKPQVFEGHRNAQTVKGVSFFGANTEYVVSGSDCGRIYIWKKKGGQLVRMMKGDKQIVNCLEPHPYATILATSGIEKTIKIWAPTAGDRLAVPDDAEELMKNNKRKREHQAHTSFPPEMIMHLLRLQRRRSENGSERRRLDVDFEEDDSILTSYSMDDSTEDDEDEDQDDDSSDDGDHMADQNCIVS